MKKTLLVFCAMTLVACGGSDGANNVSGMIDGKPVDKLELNKCIERGSVYRIVYGQVDGDCGYIPSVTIETDRELTLPDECDIVVRNDGCKVKNSVVCTQLPRPGTGQFIDSQEVTTIDWGDLSAAGTYSIRASIFSPDHALLNECNGFYELSVFKL